MASSFNISAYTRNQPELRLFPEPIVARRAPQTSDINYPIGQLWIEPKNTSNVAVNGAWILTSVISNSATWSDITGGAGSFTTLTVTGQSTLGATTIVGTTLINASGAAATTIGTGGTGTVSIGNSTGNTAITGTLTTSGAITASTGNITASAGNLVSTLGSVSAATTVTAGTGVTATVGNITATSGNFVLSGAGTFISMPGPVFIYSGAGVPSNALALHVGDMYINTTAASAVTRLYIATAASTWTNVTCAA